MKHSLNKTHVIALKSSVTREIQKINKYATKVAKSLKLKCIVDLNHFHNALWISYYPVGRRT